MAERVGIYEQRARLLSGFFDFAQQVMFRHPAARSMMLSAAQYWNDEATDAVQDDIVFGSALVPGIPHEDVRWDQRQDFDWQSNTTAVWAFTAMCHEEGWEPSTCRVNPELKHVYLYFNSPLMLVQRIGDELHASWLGAPLRAWLDFPTSQQEERGYRGHESLPVPIPDPPMPELTSRERELYDQVLADPYDRGARDVLRDLWIQRGDPRGEFSTVTSSDEPALRARAADLVARFGRAWLGGLQPVIPLSGARFGYGPFVEEAIVYAPDQAAFDRVADAPEWGCVQRVRFAPGSYRRLVPGMRNARAIGPVTWNDLAPIDVATWKVVELDIELGGFPLPDLELFDLPLKVLRLRASADEIQMTELMDAIRRQQPAPDPTREDLNTVTGLQPWKPALDALGWWRTLERVELWLPSNSAATQTLTVFDQVAPALRDGQTFTVGVLDGDQPTGWTITGDRHARRLALAHPDARFELGNELAAATGLPLEPGQLELDDWLALGLGVPSRRRAPTPA